MNANELADGLSRNQIHGDDHGLFNKRIQNMLRQQQAEIEHLKQLFGCDPAYYEKSAKTLPDEEILDALKDALSGWKYIRECHGDLYGVGWDRVQDKLEVILRKAQEK